MLGYPRPIFHPPHDVTPVLLVSHCVSIFSHFCLPINTEALPFPTSSRKTLKLIRFCCWCCIQIETSVRSLPLNFDTLGWSVLSECLQLNLLIWRHENKLILFKTRHMQWHFSSLQIYLFSSTVDMKKIYLYITDVDFFETNFIFVILLRIFSDLIVVYNLKWAPR